MTRQSVQGVNRVRGGVALTMTVNAMNGSARNAMVGFAKPGATQTNVKHAMEMEVV